MHDGGPQRFDAGVPPQPGADGGETRPDGGTAEDGGPVADGGGEAPDAGGPLAGGPCSAAACNGNEVLVCTNGVYVGGENCSLNHKRCENGVCTGCQPGYRRCAGTASIEECNPDGVSFSRTETCPNAEVCNEGRCVAAGPCGGGDKSNQGCDYWAVDLPNADVAGDVSPANAQYAVIISNVDEARTAKVLITEWNGTAPVPVVQDAEVPPGDLRVFNLPAKNADQCNSLMSCPNVDFKAYRIQTTIPVVAYQFNPLNNTAEAFSNDASLLLPSNALDREYLAVTADAIVGARDVNNPSGSRVPWGAFVSVVGTQDNPTAVTVTVPAGVAFDTPRGATAEGQVITATLAKYQVLTVLSKPADSETSSGQMAAGGGNLSGTRVSAGARVAVFSGNVATLVPHGSSGTCCADHTEEQMFPLAVWGREYVAARSLPRRLASHPGGPEPDRWRLTAAHDGTTFTYVTNATSGLSAQPQSLNAGQSVELQSTGDFAVSANQPFLLAQFMSSSGQAYNTGSNPISCRPDDANADETCTNTYKTLSRCRTLQDPIFGQRGYCLPVGDPSMTLIPPVRQFRQSYVFLTPLDYKRDFAIVIAPADATVMLDGNAIPADRFEEVGALSGVTYRRARVELRPAGRHVLTATRPVGLLVGGYDRDVSYGYPGGLNLESSPASTPPSGGEPAPAGGGASGDGGG